MTLSTREEQLKLIRQKCIEANPEITYLSKGCITLEDGSHFRPIRFADVLLAIQKIDRVQQSHFAVNTHGIFYAFYGDWKDGERVQCEYLHLGWNLRQDDLTAQPDACIQFLCELLS